MERRPVQEPLLVPYGFAFSKQAGLRSHTCLLAKGVSQASWPQDGQQGVHWP